MGRSRLTTTEVAQRNLWRWAKRRAARSGVPFGITPDDIDIPRYCPVLGLTLRSGEGTATDSSPSLDRIDPELGYVRGNVLVMSLKANRIKSDSTLKELVRVTAFMQQLKD